MNIDLANEVIAKSDNYEEVQNMKERNERRAESLEKLWIISIAILA